jgi:hypothetical protein
MYDSLPAGANDERRIFQKMLGLYDAPAFVRRTRRLEDAECLFIEHVQKLRLDKLAMVRLRVGQLRCLAGDWDALRPLVASPESLDTLRSLHDSLEPELRLPPAATGSLRRLRRALGELIEAMTLFNRRWQPYLESVDLAPLNALRDGYNRHYLIEKECALGSARVARMGFRHLDALTYADLLRQFPLLALPRIAS